LNIIDFLYIQDCYNNKYILTEFNYNLYIILMSAIKSLQRNSQVIKSIWAQGSTSRRLFSTTQTNPETETKNEGTPENE
jgi:hypothetical protein